MTLQDYLLKIGEALFVELEEITKIVYPTNENENFISVIFKNGKHLKLVGTFDSQ